MSQQPEKLGLFVDQLLRGQPALRAPDSLQERVLRQLQSQTQAHATSPWWGRGFAHWPLAARVAFLIVSCGFVTLALRGTMSVTAMLRSDDVAGAVSPAITWLHVGTDILNAIVSLGAWVFRVIPAEWLYGAALLGLVLYATLFGLGTVAYRTLYLNK
jgi:hypothetical protein